MLSLIWLRTSISTMVGGGVRGKGTGIAPGTIIRAGPTIKGSPPFIRGYRPVGEMITGIIVGKDINGTTSESLTRKFNETGTHGKRAGIGKSNKPGESKDYNPERNHNIRLRRSALKLRESHTYVRKSDRNNPDRNPVCPSNSTCSTNRLDNRFKSRLNRNHSPHSPLRRHNGPNLTRKNLNEGGKKEINQGIKCITDTFIRGGVSEINH